MSENNMILNRLFTQNVLFDMTHGESATYNEVIKRYVDDPTSKDNGRIISEIYSWMAKDYRNEYFYQNTLFNKILLGKHSASTTTALTQIPINKSKADFVLINGKAVVYEIKTELDTFDRLQSQIRDYFKAFDHVCVVTSETHYTHASRLLSDSPVGLYVLTKNNTISQSLRKEPVADNTKLNHTVIFKILHKYEQENILKSFYGKLPSTTQAFYYGECLQWFSEIPILNAYEMALQQLKKRNRIRQDVLNSIPYELKSLVYFSKSAASDLSLIQMFLSNKYGG